MDDEEQCGGTSRNDDMEEGDVYYVKSQNGWNKDARRPAECSQNFNFGDRFISLRIVEWRCDKTFENLFLAVYDNCYGTRSHLKVRTCNMMIKLHGNVFRIAGLCAGNHLWTRESRHTWPVTATFDDVFVVDLNRLFNKWPGARWYKLIPLALMWPTLMGTEAIQESHVFKFTHDNGGR